MVDQPSAEDLVEAVRHFLETELVPTLTDPRQRFRTLVAINVLAIVNRELAGQEGRLHEDWTTLETLLGEGGSPPARLSLLKADLQNRNARLVERIQAGEFDAPERFALLIEQLRLLVDRKLEVNNPRYLRSIRDRGD
jgi:hypothetical protein